MAITGPKFMEKRYSVNTIRQTTIDGAPLSATQTSPKNFLLMFASLTAVHFVVDMNGGMFPMYKAKMGMDISQSAIWAAVASSVASLCQPFFGILADRQSAKRWIVLGTLIAAGMTFAVSFSDDIHLIFILLLAQGLGISAFHPAGTGQAGRSAPPRFKGTAISLFIMFGTMGFAFSHSAVSLSFDITRDLWGWRTGFLIPLFILSIAAVCFALFIPLPQPRLSLSQNGIRQIRETLSFNRRPLLLFFVLNIVVSGMQLGSYFVLPEFLRSRGYSSSIYNGGAYSCFVMGSALMMVIVGYLSDRYGRRGMAIASFIAAIPLYFSFVLGGSVSVWILLPLCFAIGGAIGAVGPLAVAGAHDLMPPQNLSLVSGIVMGAAWAVGSSVRIPMGLVTERCGFDTAYLALGSLLFVGLIASMLLPRETITGNAAPASHPVDRL